MRDGRGLARLKPPDAARLIAETTRIEPVPLVPEIRIATTRDLIGTWEASNATPPPFWAFPWIGGQALARHLLDGGAVSGWSVLDLGAGSGLVAIAAALSGAKHVIAAEIDPVARQALALNAAENGVLIDIAESDVMRRDPPMVDTLLIGDLFYERDLAGRVLAFARAARAQGADVLVGDPGRTHFPRAEFEMVAEYAVPVSREIEDADVKTGWVWRLKAR